ncbi:hypothetical protein ACFS7Z_19520 [Pontibacter toksunensis]|uniref:Secreted protein n=1 Tax=Pontibacter toksunensis TaxID=1332631 RepID=A0ABW6BZE9_9BACT
MNRNKASILAALFLSSSFLLASCGGEPEGEHLPPEATQGDYLGHDDLDTTDTANDTTLTDSTQLVQ